MLCYLIGLPLLESLYNVISLDSKVELGMGWNHNAARTGRIPTARHASPPLPHTASVSPSSWKGALTAQATLENTRGCGAGLREAGGNHGKECLLSAQQKQASFAGLGRVLITTLNACRSKILRTRVL